MKEVSASSEDDAALRGGAQAGERVELLHRRVGAAREPHAGVEQLPVRVGAVEAVGPQPRGQLAVARGVRVLDRGGDAEAGEARDVVRMHALRVLDAVAQPERAPQRLGRLEGVERLAVGEIADRVHGDGQAGRGGLADDDGEVLRAHQPHPAAADQQRGARAERPVHEGLDVVAAGGVGVRQRLPHAQRQLAGLAQRGEGLGRAAGAVLVVHAGDARGVGGGDAGADRVERLGRCGGGVGVEEVPGVVLAQDPVVIGELAHARRARRGRLDARPVASRSAAVLTHSVWPSCARSAVGTSPVTSSRAARVGRSPSGHSSSRQPRPRSQPSAGFSAASMRSSASDTERVPNSRSSRRPSAQLGKWTWASTSPGSDGRAAEVDPLTLGVGRRDPVAGDREPVAALPDPRVDEHDGTVSGHAPLHGLPDLRLRRDVRVVRL